MLAAAAALALFATGCGPSAPPMSQAPPIAVSQPQMTTPVSNGSVYQWQDVPVNQQVPITRAVFDQGGYQLFAQTGETIVVPFVNQNLYAMKFGQTSGQPYFVNAGGAPILYLPPGGFLENAAAQGARWYPFSQGYNYTQPVYVGIAPSWSDYVGMGWYPGMHYYGGMWGVTPYNPVWMPGYYVSIGGAHYTSYNSYHSYYTTHTNYVPMRSVYTNYGVRSTGSFGTGRSTSAFGRPSGGTGAFGNGRAASGSTGSFGRGGASGGFGSAPTGGGFGRGASGGGFASPRSQSSFGSGGSGFSNTPRASGGSFGTGRASGGSFSSGRSGGFGGGGRSTGGSFRRR
ncbi:MAG TPA: hypothetical protein VKT77_08780 [Chthonomonadaceae bacterium]|nr:hypothetical protein [Chthonomonadaceae bacterium]